MRWLQATMTLDEGFIPAALARRHRVDVNGRPLSAGLITLTGKVPGRLEPIVLLIRLRPDDTVISVEASLLGNLMAARTEDVYDRAGFTKSSRGCSADVARAWPGSTSTAFSRIR